MNENDNDQDDELPRFDHIQRMDGSRYLRIHTENVDFLVAVHGDDLDRLKERLEQPPNVQ